MRRAMVDDATIDADETASVVPAGAFAWVAAVAGADRHRDVRRCMPDHSGDVVTISCADAVLSDQPAGCDAGQVAAVDRAGCRHVTDDPEILAGQRADIL